MMISRIVLGTAQLGLPYGINNPRGMPTTSEAEEILDLAWSHGIRMLDTAEAYGCSHETIGAYVRRTGNRFCICTKIKSENSSTLFVAKKIVGFLKEFGVDSIECLFLHRFEDLKEKTGLIVELESLRRDGLIRSIGVSLYETEELDYLLNGPFDLVDTFQIPVNILNRTFPNHPGFHDALSRGKRFFARSVFVQGLLFASDSVAGKVHKQMITINKMLREQCRALNVDISRLAFSYVYGISGIEKMVVGCDRSDQLLTNIELEQNAVEFPHGEIAAFAEKELRNIPKEIYDPRFWGK